MIAAMATTRAKAGAEEALVTAAQDHGRALRDQPGCHGTHVLLERTTRTVVSISIFEDDAALERALEATRPILARHGIEQLWESPPTFTRLEVR